MKQRGFRRPQTNLFEPPTLKSAFTRRFAEPLVEKGKQTQS
jgi:hypothetical protein